MSRPDKLSPEETNCLVLLTDMLREKRELSEGEKEKLAVFMADCIGNMELNAVIYSSKQELMHGRKIDRESIFMVLKMTFNTRFIAQLNDKFDLISSSRQRLLKEEPLTDNEKLTIVEYAILHNLAALQPECETLEHYGITAKHANLKQLQENVKRCRRLQKLLEKLPGKKQVIKDYKNRTGLSLFEHPMLDALLKFFANLKQNFVKNHSDTPSNTV